MPNLLASEQSPYLRQHADNPVDWRPFGKAAFEEAQRLDRPILLSIGYSACHWCHVMAHESFENEATAALMNERFVSIKVDREELPDVDQIYQRALALQGESGGWPLTMFLTPDGTPYFGGTYFPPADRYGRPGFPRVLTALSDAWKNDKNAIVSQSRKFADGLAHLAARELEGSEDDALSDENLEGAIRQLLARIDPAHGGFGGAPKFPNASALRLLLRGARRARRRGLAEAGELEAAFHKALVSMAEGGIYDQVGHGFARYSTDAMWLVPHFEKMLYDNGQLMRIYAEGWQRTQDPRYARVLRDTAAFLEREMRAPEGGLYTALDADSDGVEGRFYVWAYDELAAVLDAHELELATRAFGVTKAGNWNDPHGHAPPSANVLHVAAHVDEDLSGIRHKLFVERAKRNRPGTDDKILAGMNGLALTGLAEAARALGDDTLLAAARRTADFILDKLMGTDGRLRRVYKSSAPADKSPPTVQEKAPGIAKLPGTLDDHAFVAEGLFALYEATFETRWFDAGVSLLRVALALFYDEQKAAFYVTAASEDEMPVLIERPLSGHDGAIPAGASVLTELLLVVGEALDERAFLDAGEKLLRRRAAGALAQPFAYAHLLGAMDTLLEGPSQIVLAGNDTKALERAVGEAFVPGKLLVRRDGAPKMLHMLVADKSSDGAAFVCRQQRCEAPTRDAASLRASLSA